jgi:NADPH:quinone reductase-like Zn-dependent oxidoreductase
MSTIIFMVSFKVSKDTQMKAIVCTKYGPPEVLQLKEVEKPTPKDNEVLVKIFAVVVGIEDPMQRKGKPYFGRIFVGFTKPRRPILGTEFSGEIEAVGKNVKLFKKGDKVFGSTDARFGCNAEYMCMPEDGFLSIKLPKISYEEAAPVCGALQAWNLLKSKANIQSGQKVLINDASGSIGSAAVQIAKIFGAEVTGVSCTDNLEFVKSLGADKVIDYTTEDFTQNGQAYDAILDVTGKPSFTHSKNSLKKRGFYLTTYPKLSVLLQMFLTGIFNGKKVIFSATGLIPVSKRLKFLKDLILLFEEGKLKTIIDRNYRLDQIVKAHRYVEQGHMRGNVVISVEHRDCNRFCVNS